MMSDLKYACVHHFNYFHDSACYFVDRANYAGQRSVVEWVTKKVGSDTKQVFVSDNCSTIFKKLKFFLKIEKIRDILTQFDVESTLCFLIKFGLNVYFFFYSKSNMFNKKKRSKDV